MFCEVCDKRWKMTKKIKNIGLEKERELKRELLSVVAVTCPKCDSPTLRDVWDDYDWEKHKWVSHHHYCLNCGARFPEKGSYEEGIVDSELKGPREYMFVRIGGENIPKNNPYARRVLRV